MNDDKSEKYHTTSGMKCVEDLVVALSNCGSREHVQDKQKKNEDKACYYCHIYLPQPPAQFRGDDYPREVKGNVNKS